MSPDILLLCTYIRQRAIALHATRHRRAASCRKRTSDDATASRKARVPPALSPWLVKLWVSNNNPSSTAPVASGRRGLAPRRRKALASDAERGPNELRRPNVAPASAHSARALTITSSTSLLNRWASTACLSWALSSCPSPPACRSTPRPRALRGAVRRPHGGQPPPLRSCAS